MTSFLLNEFLRTLSVVKLAKQNDLSPSLQPYYRTFNATTRQSVPVFCIGYSSFFKFLPLTPKRQVPTFRI